MCLWTGFKFPRKIDAPKLTNKTPVVKAAVGKEGVRRGDPGY